MRFPVLFLGVVMLVCAIAASAWALPGATSQTWTFATPANPSAPTTVDNPYGAPSALITVDANGTGYYDTMPEVYGTAQGWWDIGTASIELTVPNSPDTGAGTYKDITVWVKYWKDISDAPLVSVSPTAVQTGLTSQLLEQGPMGGAWWADTWTFHIEPNPSTETITLAGNFMGSQIDEIRVNTVCSAAVPEPGCLAYLLGSGVLGATGLVRRRRRA